MDALGRAVQGYEGGVVVVSHDEHFLCATCPRLLLLEAGRLTELPSFAARGWLKAGDLEGGRGFGPIRDRWKVGSNSVFFLAPSTESFFLDPNSPPPTQRRPRRRSPSFQGGWVGGYPPPGS